MREIIFVVFLVLAPAVSLSAPAIGFDHLKFDMGEVKNDDIVEHVFEFINNGDEELIIKKLLAS
jgi:hypothetical protein